MQLNGPAEVIMMMVLPLLTWSRSALFAPALAPSSSFADCTNDPGAAQNASNFIRNPSSLLGGPSGSLTAAEFTSAVRGFVAANPQALAEAIGLFKRGGLSTDEQMAIGTGVGFASGVCTRPAPTFAAEIQTQIAGTASADMKQAYAAAAGNELNVGGDAGGAGSTGSVGGPTNPTGSTPSGGSTALAFTSNSVSYTPANFFTRSASGAGSVGTTTSTTLTIVCVVSQTCP
jgi:hypothetical protein